MQRIIVLGFRMEESELTNEEILSFVAKMAESSPMPLTVEHVEITAVPVLEPVKLPPSPVDKIMETLAPLLEKQLKKMSDGDIPGIGEE